jgi:hypothetical protein
LDDKNRRVKLAGDRLGCLGVHIWLVGVKSYPHTTSKILKAKRSQRIRGDLDAHGVRVSKY